MAISDGFRLASISGKPDTRSRSGAMNRNSSGRSVIEACLPRRRAVAARVDLLDGKPARRSFSAWSSISAISGLTTSAVPPRAIAGSW